LAAHVRDRGAGEMEPGIDADRDHAVPYRRRRVLEVREDDQAGIVHQRVKPPEAGQREVDDALAGGGILEVLVAGGCAAAGYRDFRDDAVSHRRIEAAAVLRHAGIVHDDRAAACRNESGVGGAKAPPCPGNDSDLAVEANRRHG
jgi:hypothetical protein